MEYVWWGKTQPTAPWHHLFAGNWKSDVLWGFQYSSLYKGALQEWVAELLHQTFILKRDEGDARLKHHRCTLKCSHSLNTQTEEESLPWLGKAKNKHRFLEEWLKSSSLELKQGSWLALPFHHFLLMHTMKELETFTFHHLPQPSTVGLLRDGTREAGG